MLKNVVLIDSFILNVTSSGLFQEGNVVKYQHTKRMGIASFYSIKDLLYIEQVYEHASTPLEQRELLNLAPEPLFQVSKVEELLDYVHYLPLPPLPLQEQLHPCALTCYVFGILFLSDCVCDIPEASRSHQLHQFEFICRAISNYKEYNVVTAESHHHFCGDIWLVEQGGEINTIIRMIALHCKESSMVK